MGEITQKVQIFRGRQTPIKEGVLVGYGAILEAFDLPLPTPAKLSLIWEKNPQFETREWKIFGIRKMPEDTLYQHLVFALRYEGINLLLLKKLFEKLDVADVVALISIEKLGQYSRRIWFLYEWLMQKELPVTDLKSGNYISLLNEDLQYGSSNATRSPRHRVLNNLPGVVNFCPLIFKSPKLEKFMQVSLSEKTANLIDTFHADILRRTSAFLLLKDSKASFSIERETPTPTRASRWANALGQAGGRSLTETELIRLQQIVIENSRFVKMGFRTEPGFVGEHDRITGEPIPEHISARWQDIEILMQGLIEMANGLESNSFHPVLAATKIAFGFVFIHPFVDGNGRIHRYLIHHVLARQKFSPQGIIFPVSAAILEHLDDYRKILENYSAPLLEYIAWKETKDHNIEVLNQTIDYYRYFDATPQAEFLFDCIAYTLDTIIPTEVAYLQKYDAMKNWLDEKFQMPDRMVDLLIRFLSQNKGKVSKRALDKEFKGLTEEEASEIENEYSRIFNAPTE